MARRALWTGVLAVLALMPACVPALAELREAAQNFIADQDALDAMLDEVGSDRQAMSQHLSDAQLLEADVTEFFEDRGAAHLLRVKRTIDRKLMRKACRELGYAPGRIRKPAPPTGNLQHDAQSYIEHYDAWKEYQRAVRDSIRAIENALSGSDSAALYDAVTGYFDNRRARHEARLQWQSDLRAMKKEVGFKGTGKPEGPPGETLISHVTEFLEDRDEWKTLGDTVDSDRDAIEAALNDASTLQNAVLKFFADRRLLRIKGHELAMDRKAMRKDVGLGGEKLFVKVGAAVASGAEDMDDEQEKLEETSDASGDK